MGLILILAWMYSTSEFDELFQILNLIEKDLNLKGLEPHWSNTTVCVILDIIILYQISNDVVTRIQL